MVGPTKKVPQTRVQNAALPWRRSGNARTHLMLVTSRESIRWVSESRRCVVPKGRPKKRKLPRRTAASEALEEAIGVVGRHSIGTYSPMGSRITRLHPVHGFCLEAGGAATLFLATYSEFRCPHPYPSALHRVPA
jgi:hypothetical protein